MYALLCGFIFIFIVLWMGLITKVLINVRRENEIKANNQMYHTHKLTQLYGEVKKTEERKEA